MHDLQSRLISSNSTSLTRKHRTDLTAQTDARVVQAADSDALGFIEHDGREVAGRHHCDDLCVSRAPVLSHAALQDSTSMLTPPTKR